MRLITPAVAWQLAARVVAGYDGPMDAVDWTPGHRDRGRHRARRRAGRAPARPRRRPGGAASGCDRRYAERARRQDPAGRRAAAASGSASSCFRWCGRTPRRRPSGRSSTTATRWRSRPGSPPRHPEVGAAERARYQVVLLDEFQDTSHAQLELMRALFGGGHPVTAVGDPCQSIYGWRGASAGNLKRFARRLPGRPPDGAGAARRGQAAVDQLPQHRQGPRRRRARSRATCAQIAPEVPRLIAPPDRADRGVVTCALLETSAAEAAVGRRAGRGAARLPAGLAPDGQPWPDGRPRQRPAVRHRGAVPQAGPVRGAADRARGRAASRSRWSASAAC